MSEEHKQRLREKAQRNSTIHSHNDITMKNHTGHFDSLYDTSLSSQHDSSTFRARSRHRSQRKTRVKKIFSSPIATSFITAVCVSSLFAGYIGYTELSQKDNLNSTAAGNSTQQHSNDKVYPNPPSPDKDTLRPAHVHPDIAVNKRRAVAIGDSTVAWSDGEKLGQSLGGCETEKATWADNINIKNMSCPGMTTRDITEMIRTHSDVIRDAETLFITAGSNDVRGDEVGGLDAGIEMILATVKDINPQAHIIFIGYLPVYLDASCMDIKDRNSARRLYDFHRKANYAMQDAALRNSLTYIDVLHSPFDVCNPNTSYVRIPRHNTEGATWHTTSQGHRKISDTINSVINWI